MKDKEFAIKVNGIHKDFILPQSKHTSIKQAAVNIIRKNNKTTQHVLDGIDFEVYKGDFFGIVGRNGSGKSTLLKLIAGVYTPTKGSLDINGGITPFIELGVGFNMELSGRDNIYLNGALLGFTRTQMDGMYDDIVDFAELGPFMDQKLKNYSSGMQVRLAFSIAIKAKNDILIFDEVLAVGDEAFQKKCLDIFEQYKANKQTVILVTHDMNTVKKFCNRAILLKDGKIIEHGSPQEVATEYSRLNSLAIDLSNDVKNEKLYKSQGEKHVAVKFYNNSSQGTHIIEMNDRFTVSLSIKNDNDIKKIESIGLTIIKQSGEHIGGLNSRYGYPEWDKKSNLNVNIFADFAPGTYSILVELFSEPGKVIESVIGPTFEVSSNREMNWSGLVHLRSEWSRD